MLNNSPPKCYPKLSAQFLPSAHSLWLVHLVMNVLSGPFSSTAVCCDTWMCLVVISLLLLHYCPLSVGLSARPLLVLQVPFFAVPLQLNLQLPLARWNTPVQPLLHLCLPSPSAGYWLWILVLVKKRKTL